MKRVIIIGNSCSGKSTLAKSLSQSFTVEHYDLDDYFWKCNKFKKSYSHKRILTNVKNLALKESWVIEGVYSHLVEPILHRADIFVWIDLPLQVCINNLISRDVNPTDLQLSRTQGYFERTTGSSRASHQLLWDSFTGSKYKINDSTDLTQFALQLYTETKPPLK